jgi:hypothetical protein
MKTYPIIPETEEILKVEGKEFAAFGVGNEKRDLVLLTRGDLEVERTVCVSFFACVHCGFMATGTAGFHKMGRDRYKVVVCTHCEAEGTVWYFDGIWKGSRVRIKEGVRDNKITMCKM